MKKNKNFILGVGIDNLTKKEVLEEIKKWFGNNQGFFQIFTVNPEFLVLAQKNKKFKKTLNKAQMTIADGVGVLWAGKILDQAFKERVTGVELMKEMIKMAHDLRLTVGLIGGKDNVALETAECLKKTHPDFSFFALEGVKNRKRPTSVELTKIVSIIAEDKPQMLFIAFGAPWQEFFIDSLKKELKNDWPMIAMGVGGSFDEISGRIKQVPVWMDKIGLKWLWRLIQEPWRWKRQLALLEFIFLVFKGRTNKQKPLNL
ncbi:WecB/TagA/CpsF family glycosyltransferase [Candidatus Microgenomates bacterium]|nr:WecB/TagA/CpsF family glycosyltransferase [Candidatus Microgenomates bacterium]